MERLGKIHCVQLPNYGKVLPLQSSPWLRFQLETNDHVDRRKTPSVAGRPLPKPKHHAVQDR